VGVDRPSSRLTLANGAHSTARHHEGRVGQDGQGPVTATDLLRAGTLRPQSLGTDRNDAGDNGRVTSASDLASLAALLADETRAAMCLALLDGRAWTAGELAAHARVAPSTATEHLHRVTADAALRRGRTCYDHLAGRLGVAVTDAMTAAGLLDQTGGFALTKAGLAWLTDSLGLSPEDLRPGKRPLARGCVDWTERRQHLAGLAGAKLCETFFAKAWVARIGSGRAVRITPSGKAALRNLLGLSDMDRGATRSSLDHSRRCRPRSLQSGEMVMGGLRGGPLGSLPR
jgi:hypothetical protein